MNVEEFTMGAPLLEEITAGDGPALMPLTVDQYHDMIRTGILHEGTPIELIDGILIAKDRSSQGGKSLSHDPPHALCITRLQRLDRLLEPIGVHLRLQLPVTLGRTSEPEPDVAVVLGKPESFANRHPGPKDLVAVMEVADSSLRYDRTTKQRKYAEAGIPHYWIVNLADRQIEVYDSPVPAEGVYGQRSDFLPGQTVRLDIGGQFIEVAVNDILS
jgi:Uma2 family endonuclease